MRLWVRRGVWRGSGLFLPGSASEGFLAHGDLAPRNLLATEAGWALIDWGKTRPHEPFNDLCHFLVQAHALLGIRAAPLAGVAGAGRPRRPRLGWDGRRCLR
jgi:aminoglycoside phosphotransferase (APT) family kinase protein